MFCEKCGAQIPEGVKFCGVCGLPVKEAQPAQQQAMPNQQMPPVQSVQQQGMPYQQMQMPAPKPPKQKKEKVKKEGGVKINASMIIAAVLAVALVLSLLGVIPSLNILGGSKSGRVEGNGFDTPEEAVEAYIKALNNGDIDGMISTFAIESYVDNFDTKAHIERNGAFVPNMPFSCAYELSDGSDFDRDIRINVRRASIIYQLYRMIGQQIVHHNSQVVGPLEGKDLDDFMKKIEKSDFLNDWKEMELIEFVEPEDVCELFSSDKNQEHLEAQTKPYCCEEIAEVCALVELDGEEYYQFAQCGMYDGKWYIITPISYVASLEGLSVDYWGLAPASEIR